MRLHEYANSKALANQKRPWALLSYVNKSRVPSTSALGFDGNISLQDLSEMENDTRFVQSRLSYLIISLLNDVHFIWF